MFYENELRFLQKTLDKCHLANAVIHPDEAIVCDDSAPLQPFRHYWRLSGSFFEVVPDLKPATVYRLMDVFLCRYLFLELPYHERPSVLLVGPYLNADVTQQQILEQAELLKWPPANSRELELFYSGVPVVRDEHHLFAMVGTFAEYVFAGEQHYRNVDLYFDHKILSPETYDRDKSAQAENLNAEVLETRYQFENELIDAVAQGNAHKAELMMAAFSSLTFENRISDPLRNMKNYCIIMNTLMRKAAEKGGVHPVHLDHVSAGFAHRIEGLRSLNDISNFMLEMMRSYCRLVKQHATQGFSPVVQRAMIRIDSDLAGDLSLHTVAAQNNISPGYLSGLFKKETGQTYTAYVNGRRIAMAVNLLKTTHLQVQTIAQHCGILDFHYFCRLFKRMVGMTPTAYRAERERSTPSFAEQVGSADLL